MANVALQHVIYDWIPDDGKDIAMDMGHERYVDKRRKPGNADNYLHIKRELTLLAQETDVATTKTLTAKPPPPRRLLERVFRRRTGALANVPANAVVVIIAHGSKTQPAVAYQAGTTFHIISARNLAEMLKLDGLSKLHRYIKLNSCYAAGGHDFALSATFAQELAIELGKIGYKRVRVGGYQNKLSSPGDADDPKQSHYYDGHEKDITTKASGGRTWYDADGSAFTGKLSDLVSS